MDIGTDENNARFAIKVAKLNAGHADELSTLYRDEGRNKRSIDLLNYVSKHMYFQISAGYTHQYCVGEKPSQGHVLYWLGEAAKLGLITDEAEQMLKCSILRTAVWYGMVWAEFNKLRPSCADYSLHDYHLQHNYEEALKSGLTAEEVGVNAEEVAAAVHSILCVKATTTVTRLRESKVWKFDLHIVDKALAKGVTYAEMGTTEAEMLTLRA